MASGSRWSEDELVVLIALYRRHGLTLLDDSQQLCQDFASAIGRTASAVDRQTRNLDDIVRERGVQHSGSKVARLYEHYSKRNMRGLNQAANDAIDRNNWAVTKL
jgi:hypothetical protein